MDGQSKKLSKEERIALRAQRVQAKRNKDGTRTNTGAQASKRNARMTRAAVQHPPLRHTVSDRLVFLVSLAMRFLVCAPQIHALPPP